MFFRNISAKSKGLFYRWLLSYVSILLIPMLISGVVSMVSMGVMMEETNAAIDRMLEQAQRNIDDKLRSFREITIQLNLNNDLIQIMRADQQFSSYQQYSIFRLHRQLMGYVATNGYIDNIFIYHKGTNSVISKNAKMDWSYFYQRYFDAAQVREEELRTLMNEAHVADYVLLERRIWESGTDPALLLCCSLPFVGTERQTGMMMVSIPQVKFQEILQDVRWIDEYELLMVDGSGRICISDGPRRLPEAYIQEILSQGPGRSTSSYENQSYEITVAASQAGDWSFVVVMPSEVIWEKTTRIREMTQVSVLMCALAGGVIAYILTRRNYDPIDRMARALSEKKAMDLPKNDKGYSFIQMAINESIQEIRVAYSKLEAQNKALQSSQLKNLLKGISSSGRPLGVDARHFAPEGGSPLFQILLLNIEDCTPFAPEDSEGDCAGGLAMFALSNILEELIHAHPELTGHLVEIDNMLACMVYYQSADISCAVTALDALVAQCRAYLQERLFIRISVSISDFHGDVSKLPEAYREASDAMGYLRLVGGGQVARYGSLVQNKYQYDFTAQMEAALIRHLKAGDLPAAQALVEGIFQENPEGQPLSADMAKCLMYDMAGTLLKTLYEICDQDFIDGAQPLKMLAQGGNILDTKQELLTLMDMICHYARENSQSGHQLSRAVIEYIKANYHNPNLSTAAISETFHLTRTYLSTLFKAQTDQALSDYIAQVRLDKAKELLKGGNISIKDVALETGFSNSSVFIRTFKKYEGITPGEFRETL